MTCHGPGVEVPTEIQRDGLICVVSMSGGKDSTAAALALTEAGIPFRMVFADTGWEAPETYAHLDYLRGKLGPIDTVGFKGGMVGKVRYRAGFPSRMQRWCTRELKIVPLRAYHDAVEAGEGVETVSVLGIRALESAARSMMPAFIDEPPGERSWGGWIWRPILHWTAEDSYAIHHRHGVDVHPLYKRGHDRVGCYPCIFAQKEEIRLISEHAPWRIDELRALEAEVIDERARRNESQPGRYAHTMGTFFQGRGEDGRNGFLPIDRVVSWAKTSRGGKQLPLLPPVPTGGCIQYGLCEPPR
jgi:3'-phosphoadenosine 5'-phosphosulfate sulfotransferase (PAPS reductase)/FAD synthetase